MSITGCPGLLTGDVSPLMCTVTAIGGFDRSPPRIRWKGYKVVCVIHICYLSATTSLTRWIWFPIFLSHRFQPLAHSLLLSGGHPCSCHLFRSAPHTEMEGHREGNGAKKRALKARMIYSTGFHWHIYTVSGHVLGLLEISTEKSQIHTFMFCSTEMPYL